jgi:hypothetical protein
MIEIEGLNTERIPTLLGHPGEVEMALRHGNAQFSAGPPTPHYLFLVQGLFQSLTYEALLWRPPALCHNLKKLIASAGIHDGGGQTPAGGGLTRLTILTIINM